MNQNIQILYTWTSDNLRLQGVHYVPERKDVCVLLIHGMSGNFIENYFAHVLGEELAKEGFGFIYSHNRGYNHINDIAINELEEDGGYKTVRVGVTYERFLDSEIDIAAWIGECTKLGYKKIILMGHSLGSNKVIHFYHKNKPQIVKGVILASPPDLVGLAKVESNYEELLKEARVNTSNGQPRKLLSDYLWDWYLLSSQTFLDLFEEEGPADNLPILRNPDLFQELASVDVPMFGIMGENDDIKIRTLKEDLDLIASKATSCPSFTKQFIKGANHTYDRQEEFLAEAVVHWLKK